MTRILAQLALKNSGVPTKLKASRDGDCRVLYKLDKASSERNKLTTIDVKAIKLSVRRYRQQEAVGDTACKMQTFFPKDKS